MSQETAVEFATNSRIHIALAVKNLEQSVEFYRVLFGRGPSKTRPHYAKFEVSEPAVNLALNEFRGETAPGNSVAHFGIQVKSTEAVKGVADRLNEEGVQFAVEDNVTCCYAVQNKIWVTDPDGNKWEVYVVVDNDGNSHGPKLGQCCTDLSELALAGQSADSLGRSSSCACAKDSSACC